MHEYLMGYRLAALYVQHRGQSFMRRALRLRAGEYTLFMGGGDYERGLCDGLLDAFGC